MDRLEGEAIIDAVFKRPGLYDKTNAFYANRKYAAQAWKEISEETQIEEILARKKWGNLRDYFNRQYRELTAASQSGAAPVKKKKWALYDAMTFLIECQPERPTFGSLGADDDNDVNAKDIDSGADAYNNFSRGSSPSSIPLASPTTLSLQNNALSHAEASRSSYIHKRKRSLAKDEDRGNVGDRVYDALKSIPGLNSRREDDDEDYLFFRSLVPKMKCLSDIQKLELQADVNAVFLKHLKRAQNSLVVPAMPDDGFCETGNHKDATGSIENKYNAVHTD